MKERALLLAMLAATGIVGPAIGVKAAGIEDIATIVVIYAENRSFDNLYGSFPGANGLSQITPAGYIRSSTATARFSRNCRRYGMG
jgi:phospholipase C